jgi:hypothetical protein
MSTKFGMAMETALWKRFLTEQNSQTFWEPTNHNDDMMTMMIMIMVMMLLLMMMMIIIIIDRLCGLVVRFPGYRSRVQRSSPGATSDVSRMWKLLSVGYGKFS